MTTHGWKQIAKITVPNGGYYDVALPAGRPVLEKLTYLALSGTRSVAGLSFQARINGVNFGAAYAHAGPGVLAAVVFHDVVGTVTENMILPPAPGDLARGEASVPGDPIDFVMRVSSSHGVPQVITLVAAAIGRDG